MSPLLVLIVAVLATSYAGPIVRFAAAPALAIAFWRLALVLPVTGGLAVLEGSREQGAGSSVTRQQLLPAPRSLLPLMTLSGLLLALHFCPGSRRSGSPPSPARSSSCRSSPSSPGASRRPGCASIRRAPKPGVSHSP